MPIGEFRAWARWKLATILGDEDFLDDAQRRMDEYHSGILRRAERVYNYKLSQLEGFYHYNALPMVPLEMSEEEAFYNVPENKCRWWYHELDDCLFKCSNRDRRSFRMHNLRIHTCRRSWELFMKCVTNRDVAILRNIEGWERHYVKNVLKTAEERQTYVDGVRVQSEYYDYMHKITDPDKRVACYYEKRQKEHQRRLYNLLDTLAQLRGEPRDLNRPKLKRSSDICKGHYVITQH